MHSRQQLERLLSAHLQTLQSFLSSLEIVRGNSKGKIWLIGGGVYRSLLQLLYGRKTAGGDFDFIVEKADQALSVPPDWKIQVGRFGNPKLVCGDLVVDFIPLNTVAGLRAASLAPTIENYLRITPLTIQSIAFDVDSHQLIGDTGLQSVLTQTLAINHAEQYRVACEKKGDENYLATKANELGMTIAPPAA